MKNRICHVESIAAAGHNLAGQCSSDCSSCTDGCDVSLLIPCRASDESAGGELCFYCLLLLVSALHRECVEIAIAC